ncbi:AAA family ATPase [uncultured Micrococcus sp.]|uniref:AAA family ATPase n=1 Tax=uncultured Micrococcus sp. TaxID=114051 RepID=UPI0025FA5507|nr:ATP-binding protein [uncultured Micrococcus sp.]
MTTTLKSVHIERFKAAWKPDRIPLQDFNVVIGRNGSGKSTMIDALQWIDTALRRDAREACEKFGSISDLINLRSQSSPNYFKISVEWTLDDVDGRLSTVTYAVQVSDSDGLPHITSESLTTVDDDGNTSTLIETEAYDRRVVRTPDDTPVPFVDPERLALARLADVRAGDPISDSIAQFWSRAVFLRLTPASLAKSAPVSRKSHDPLLDEEGSTLATLLHSLPEDELEEVANGVSNILPGIRDIHLHESGEGRDAQGSYGLLERMPYRGRSGKKLLEIPSWMLSEGTRRITALVALVTMDSPASFLCVEEMENGLDPWSVELVIRYLMNSSDLSQVLVSTHSPNLLDLVPISSIIIAKRVEGDTRYSAFESLPEVAAFDPAIPAGVRYRNFETA